MRSELTKLLKDLKNKGGQVNPDSAWVKENRRVLLARISESASQSDKRYRSWRELAWSRFSAAAHLFVPGRVLVLARSSLAILLVASVAVSGWIATVSASQDSLPGEALYGVKVATEATELIVASVIGSEEDKATTNLKHAAKKVEEYKKAKSVKQATASIQSLKKKIESTNKSLDKVQTQSPEKAVALAKVVDDKTEEMLEELDEKKVSKTRTEKNLTDAGKNEKENVDDSAKELSKKVVEVETLLEDVGVKAVEVLVVKESEGVEGQSIAIVDEHEVKRRLEKRLDRIVSDLNELDSSISATGRIVASSTVLSDTPAALSSSTITTGTLPLIPEFISSTQILAPASSTLEAPQEALSPVSPETLAQKVVQAGQTVEEAAKKTDEGVSEAKVLIENNDLLGALKKVRELKEVKKEAAEVVSGVQKQVTEAVQTATETVGENGVETEEEGNEEDVLEEE